MPQKKSADTEARLKEALNAVLGESLQRYGLDLSEAERAKLLDRTLRDAVDETAEIFGELQIKPLLHAKFGLTIGSGVSTVKLIVLAFAAIALLLTLFGGLYVILNSPGARLWK